MNESVSRTKNSIAKRIEIMPNTIVQDHRNLPNWSEVNNESDIRNLLPIDMVFNDGHRLSITVYRLIFKAIESFNFEFPFNVINI